MPFELQVQFLGLCTYFQHPDGKRVGILMPDCRRQTNPVPNHDDRTPAEPHAGYLRFDLADLDGAVVPGGDLDNGPRYEVIHRFNKQLLKFDDLAAEAMTVSLEYPEIAKIAPILTPHGDLFTNSPTGVLMRTVLRGGNLEADPGTELWQIPDRLNPGNPQQGNYASFATWTRPVATESVVVRITSFAGDDEAVFTLRPRTAGGTVVLKVANLCGHNPLEWNELDLRQVFDDDQDFKWLYRLMEPSDGSTYRQLLGGKEFPVPKRTQGGRETGSDDCIGAVVKAGFPDPGHE